jgi:uncharacterized protein YkwD
MHRLAIVALAALALAPAGTAAQQAAPGQRDQASSGAGPSWASIANWDLSKSSSYRPLRPSQVDKSSARQSALENDLLREINEVRHEHGLKPFRSSPKLVAAAAQHTREMGVDGYFEHESFDSTAFWKRIQRWYGSRGWRSWSVGENLLYSSPDLTAGSCLEMWMESPGHRANLLSRTWREIGIAAIHFNSAAGEYEGRPVTIVTADFGVRR